MDSIFESGQNDTRKTMLFAGIAAVLMIVAVMCVVQEIGRIRQKQAFLKEYNETVARFDAGDYEEAASALEKLKKQSPKEPEVYERLGKTYEKLGMPEKALEAIEEGMSNCSPKAQQGLLNAKRDTYLNMMNQAIDAGESDYADELAQKVLELDSNNSAAKKQLELTDEKEKEKKEEKEEKKEKKETRGVIGLDAVPLSTIENLPDTIDGGNWDVKRRVQGVEWNTDTMDTVYFSVATYIVACNTSGEVKEKIKTKGYLFSMDYYDGHLFCVWRSEKYGRFKLKVLNPVSLKEENSVNLADMHKVFERDEEEYGGDLCASIDGVVVAPRIGSQDELMVYVSYNSYISKEDGIARHDQQTIYEYSLEEVLDTDRDNLTSKRRLSVDLGQVEYGIQTLELDRSTGNIWCAIRQGYSDYSLYLIDGQSQGSHLSLIPNGSQSGWDCPEAGDGMCSLGNEQFYLLIPHYYTDSVSVKTKRVSLDQLEDF